MADLDPAGPILSRLFTLDSNSVIEIVDGVGLGVDWTLNEKQNYSNNTRKREFRPRVSTALNALTRADRLRVLGLLASRQPDREILRSPGSDREASDSGTSA